MNAIEISELKYSYDGFTAVDGVDFTVRAGEIFALLGTNGAGKTTTLEMIEGFRRPEAGRIRVFDHDPARARSRLKPRMGVMLQQAGLIEELSTAETLRLWGALSSRTDDVDAQLDRVELGHRRDTRVEQLSGGEQRRLDFALATWGRPELVVLDEPTTGLDPESRQRLWKTVERMRDEGSTILLTTHYLEEAEALADRVAIMHQGRISVAGALTDVLAAHPSRISARVPMPALDHPLPLFDGTLESTLDERGALLVVETGALQDDLGLLIDWARQHGVVLERLSATQASLSEIFLTVGAGR
ncbi:ABC transporter ATP-binding protein [Amycolatopsis sp. 195334CR]|uniref:ABC transporter ATP-binding protein n=1 Tax=Amycolatopsis sp. 195334CR TaxID=2814588 RepID=UPI001A8C8DE8|nr:ABC transporter ATP-binding protein [Amycolatopsis sp. 195334CR]MBN6036291.1 ABC transporter ATP-binding protein [Amycolatopsis sp. 195334CR]